MAPPVHPHVAVRRLSMDPGSFHIPSHRRRNHRHGTSRDTDTSGDASQGRPEPSRRGRIVADVNRHGIWYCVPKVALRHPIAWLDRSCAVRTLRHRSSRAHQRRHTGNRNREHHRLLGSSYHRRAARHPDHRAEHHQEDAPRQATHRHAQPREPHRCRAVVSMDTLRDSAGASATMASAVS